jgi:hypothetical protein
MKKLRIFLPLIYYLFTSLKSWRFFSRRKNTPWFRPSYKKIIAINKKIEINHVFFKKFLSKLSAKNQKFESGQWESICTEYSKDIFKLIRKDSIDDLLISLGNPTSNNYAYGFDNLAKDLQVFTRLETISERDMTADRIIALAEYVGVIRFCNPESINFTFKKDINIEELINKIFCKISLNKAEIFHTPFNREKGIYTKFGICSLRAPDSIYQSLRTLKFGKNICEIGGGIGRTGYFSILLGCEKYTYVDLPVAGLFQSYYIATAIEKFREDDSLLAQKLNDIEIMLPDDFMKTSQCFDIVLNVDSMTEMSEEIARGYIKRISECSKYFLSINHESNDFTVNEIVKNSNLYNLIYREKSWLRPGYIEELYAVKNIKV